VSQTDMVVFTDLGDIFPPSVAAISFADGDRAFPADGNITIMFSEPMNHTLTEGAFTISGNVTGAFAWSGWNMTFNPDYLDYSTYYTVTIGTGATDAWGNGIGTPFTATFTTARASETGGGVMIFVIVAIFVVAGIAGWLVLRRMK
jgi:hypothetical protein